LNLVGTGSGMDLDSQFATPDWIWTKKNQSPNTSTTYPHRVVKGPNFDI